MTKMVKYLLGFLVILLVAYVLKPSWFKGEGFEDDDDEGFEDDEEGFEDEEEGFEDEEEGFEDEDE